MKRVITAAGLLVAFATTALAADAPAQKPRPDIYDRKANGNQQIQEALKTAQAEHKRVLLKFGANWCGWCHKLSGLFHSNPEIAAQLKNNYVLVLIDVDQVDGHPHNDAIVQRYGNPTRFGLPVLVVLDSDGNRLTTQDTGQLEEGDHHDPRKVMAFLDKWKPVPASKP
ncbi:MAG: thioredoxin family protein [Verrucomicrobiota bacterium]